jgi:hypothetical protein
MEKLSVPEMSEEDIQTLREKLRELGTDLTGTLAGLSPEVQREYRVAEQQCVDARLDSPGDHAC